MLWCKSEVVISVWDGKKKVADVLSGAGVTIADGSERRGENWITERGATGGGYWNDGNAVGVRKRRVSGTKAEGGAVMVWGMAREISKSVEYVIDVSIEISAVTVIDLSGELKGVDVANVCTKKFGGEVDGGGVWSDSVCTGEVTVATVVVLEVEVEMVCATGVDVEVSKWLKSSGIC